MSIMRLKFAFTPIIGGVWGDEPKGDSNDMVCVRVADFDDQAGKVSTEKLTKRNISPSEQRGRVLQRGDLLLEKSGGGEQTSVGRSVRFDHDFTAVSSNFIALLRPRDGHDASFLTYLMRALYHGGGSIPHIKQTTGIQNLDCDSYLSRAFNFPATTDERRIAGYLDEATGKVDRLVALRRRQMELLREERAALIQQAVTRGLNPRAPLKDSGLPWLGKIPKHWDEPTRLKYVSTLKGRLGWQGLKAEEYRDEGPYVVSSAHFENFRILCDQCPRVTQERYELDSNIQLREGDLLLMKDGAALGKLAFVDTLPGPACLNSHLLLLRPIQIDGEPCYDPQFLFCLMQTSLFQEQIKVSATGTTFFGVSQEAIGELRVALPPLDEQEEILAHIRRATTKLDGLHRSYVRQLALLAEYRAALIHECVTGQRAVPATTANPKEN